MTFRVYAKRYARIIEKVLMRGLREKKKEVKGRVPRATPFIDFFAQANLGGGRIRGVLTVLGYQTAGGGDLREIAKVAVAHELLQTSILAQDDIIDRSLLRRGRPTLYKIIADWHKRKRMLGDSLHFGISQALSISDIGFFLASDIIAQSNFPPENKIKAISDFNKIIAYIGLGQLLDVNLPAQRAKKREKDVFDVERFKTAQYTVIGPLTMGAHLAGAGQGLINNLREFGLNLGIAFQIQDDLKGIFGKEEETGKSAKGDIEEGKITLLYIYAMKNATREKRKVLEKFYGKGKIKDSEAEKVREVFVDTGAMDYGIQKSQEYALRARVVIEKLSKDTKIRNLYTELCDYLLVFKA